MSALPFINTFQSRLTKEVLYTSGRLFLDQALIARCGRVRVFEPHHARPRRREYLHITSFEVLFGFGEASCHGGREARQGDVLGHGLVLSSPRRVRFIRAQSHRILILEPIDLCFDLGSGYDFRASKRA